MTRRSRGRWTALLALLLAGLCLVTPTPPAQAQLFSGASPFPAPAPATGTSPAPAPTTSTSPAPVTGTTAAPASITSTSASTAPTGDATPEFRGLWVDAYRDGYDTPAQVDQLLADARRANINALLVQMRARGDSLYSKSLEPRVEDAAIPADFDPLAYLIQKAHNDQPRIEVQAWIVVTNIWGSQTRMPADPHHVYNLHGPNATGADDWLSRREDGTTWSRGYFIDPGNPDAAKYTTDVALNIVREYDVDGLHLDYIRYPERADGLSWGYNQISIDRFNAQNNRTGKPTGNDPLWSQWRQDQISALVRGIYQGALAIKPQVKVSAAVIPWGDGPRVEADWQKTSAYSSVFQDWRSWLEEGILDQAMPMTYFRESAASQPAWFDHWVAWARDHAYGRQIIPAVALYLNDPAESINQVRRALTAAPGGAHVAGVALYSYGATRAGGGDTGVTTRAQSAEVWAALTDSGTTSGGQAPFATRAAPPTLAWKQGTLSQVGTP